MPGHSDFPGGDEFDYTKEDHDPDTQPHNLKATWRHFRDIGDVQPDMDNAIASCNKDAFERAAHQGQDFWSHAGAGHTPGSHAWAGHEPDNSYIHSQNYGEAAQWTQKQLDNWNKNCCKQDDGGWKKCCPNQPPPSPPATPPLRPPPPRMPREWSRGGDG